MERMAFNPYKPSKAHKTLWVRGNDHLGQLRRMSAFRSPAATDRLCRVLTDMVETVGSGGVISDKTLEWVNNALDEKRREQLIQWGLISRSRLVIGLPLEAHLQAWKEYMTNSGLTPKHVHQEHLRAKSLIDACKVESFSDLRPDAVLAVSKERQGVHKWSATTHRGYLVAVKEFANWMVKMSRANTNPLLSLTIPAVKEEDVKAAQALTVDEQRRLVAGVVDLPDRAKTPGPERSLLYRLAIETGWRGGALLALRKSHCHTSGPQPWIQAPEGGRKRRTSLPLTSETAALLQKHLALKLPDAFVFAGIRRVDHLAVTIKSDCKKLGLPLIKFHDLRHTNATNLMRAGVHPKIAQEMLGHKQITTTMKVYTHVGWEDKMSALKSVASSVANQQETEIDKAKHG